MKQEEAPIASEAVRRIDMLFEIERSINGKTPEQRLAVRREQSRPLIAELEIWMRQQRALLSSKNETTKAINYLLNRWAAFTSFLDDGRVCLTNNAAERALRGVAVGRRNWTFAGSDAGGHRAAAVYTLYPDRNLKDERRRSASLVPDHPANRFADLLPWNWKANTNSPRPPLQPECFTSDHRACLGCWLDAYVGVELGATIGQERSKVKDGRVARRHSDHNQL